MHIGSLPVLGIHIFYGGRIPCLAPSPCVAARTTHKTASKVSQDSSLREGDRLRPLHGCLVFSRVIVLCLQDRDRSLRVSSSTVTIFLVSHALHASLTPAVAPTEVKYRYALSNTHKTEAQPNKKATRLKARGSELWPDAQFGWLRRVGLTELAQLSS